MAASDPASVERANVMTSELLADAGIRAGMRVLDVGCGHGDVSRMAAKLVGPSGSVIGIDRSPEVLATARARVREHGLAQVELVEADLGRLGPEWGVFDAIVGRRVLMYQADVAAVLAGLVAVLRPGGVMVCEETDASMVPAGSTALPLHERVHAWIWETIRREGGDLRMGLALHGVLEAAGLVVEEVRAEAIVQTPRARRPTAMIARYMIPRMLAQGVVTLEELDIESLDQRLASELAETNASFVGDLVVRAWARKPGRPVVTK